MEAAEKATKRKSLQKDTKFTKGRVAIKRRCQHLAVIIGTTVFIPAARMAQDASARLIGSSCVDPAALYFLRDLRDRL